MAFWDSFGFDLMIAGAIVGGVALLITLASSVILYRVTSEQQSQLVRETNAFGERARILEKETANARLETARLKKEVAWRELNPDVRNRMVVELSKKSSTVTLVFVSGDAEATEYCAQFLWVFRQAGWDVQVAGRTFLGSPTGIVVTQNDIWNRDIQAEIEWLRAALTSAGVVVQKGGGAVEARVSGLSTGRTTAKVRVVIGHRPPPILE